MNEALSFYRDTWAEINLDAIEYNVKSMIRHLGPEGTVIAVVKANAYGHGDAEVAETALKAGADMLAVAFVDEAIALRKKGVAAPILVLGASRPEDVQVSINHKIILTAVSLEWVMEAGKFVRSGELCFHIKLDTGMGRLGMKERHELETAIDYAAKSPNMKIGGIFTHFATADELESDYAEHQFEAFEKLTAGLTSSEWMIHCANSAAGLRFPDRIFNTVRLGISMYGLAPSMELKGELPYPLQEALSLHTKLVHVKKIAKGEKVSYGATYTAQEDEWIGTLPIGYADGWIRRLKDSEVLADGARVPIVGRICMDQCMVRLPRKLPIGTKVTLIGRQAEESISIDEIAERLETINYEVPCILSARVPRMFLQNKSIMEVRNPIIQSFSAEKG
ncbi:alanine racemase [Bacillus sp. FJAT-42376]|uniref:alanine racemase n=1 Tax=Bacillus sp. FJAT-42376 TaxID=2014076 RepID=UPI000F4DA361|nr:alanine racemase [Bacillus sp. FJAT-42376]AZB41379.1 alanine racemase [Bacillus sp. FJAT-42376]